MFTQRARAPRDPRQSKGRTPITQLALGLVAGGMLLGANVAEAQTRRRLPPDFDIRRPIVVNPIVVTPVVRHPTFVAKLREGQAFRVADHDQDEDICAGTGELQHVRDYDGSLGQSRAFVDAHKGPVGKLVTNELCSGTFIARNLFLTASHCVDNLTASMDRVAFNFEKLAGETGAAQSTSYAVTELVQDGDAVGLDFAIVRLADNVGQPNANPGDSFGITPIEPLTPAVSHLITVIQHPLGELKQVEVGHVHSYGTDDMRYDDLDTLGGSSGAGILDDAGRLVGVHTHGGCDVGDQNGGVPMASIVNVSQTVRDLLPPNLLARRARIRDLHVLDRGQSYGQPGDALTVEAVLLLDGSDQAYGFTLRTGTDEEAHDGMFELVRAAVRKNVPLHIEYFRETHRTNRIMRVLR